jgi:hypothetical protein
MGLVGTSHAVAPRRRRAARSSLVALIALLAVLVALGAHARPAAARGPGADWAHVLQVVANLQATPPSTPVVLLFGGSSARECTIDDARWAAAVMAGLTPESPAVACYNLGSSNQSYRDDIELVRALPQGATTPTIVLIGVSLGRFNAPRTDPTITLPDPVDPLPAYRQHRYSKTHILTATEKRALLKKWLQERYPVFKRHYPSNILVLESLIKTCLRRGLHPVMVDLPRDLALIGHALDAPITRYHKGCTALARTYKVPFVNFVGAARLVNRDFYDLWHLVEPGRAKWQPLLAERTIALLTEYGIGSSAR